MRASERALEWLRPLVGSKSWDYCVLWKLGDDPTRFIEWMGCCCGGAENYNTKERRVGEFLPCRDIFTQHPIRTKGCETLANLPCFMSLYSGIHGEVIISTQPRWINFGNTLESNPPDETVGTLVLIPVIGGLIELFAAKHIPKDQQFIEFVMTQCNVFWKQEAMTLQSNEQPLGPVRHDYIYNWSPSLDCLSFIGRQQFLTPGIRANNDLFFKGSSTGSISSYHLPSFNSISCHGPRKVVCLKQSAKISGEESFGDSSVSIEPGCDNNFLKQEMDLVLGRGICMDEKDNLKISQRSKGKHYLSRNLIAERNRRRKMKDNLFALRALVPKISKMDRASILIDAAEYIEELQREVRKLHDELWEIEKEDYNEISIQSDISNLNGVRNGGGDNNIAIEEDHHETLFLSVTEHNQDSSSVDNMEWQMEVQVEVKQMGRNEFFVKFFCKQKLGGFVRLMEAMDSLGLQVNDANVTTVKGKVLNILKVEAKNEKIEAHQVRELLLELSRNP